MDRAQVVQDGDRLIVILPEMYRLPVGEVSVSRSGTSVLLTPIVDEPLVLPPADDPWTILRASRDRSSAGRRQDER